MPTPSPNGVLVLALARAGWGETTLGLRVAQDLAAAGAPVTFLAHQAVRGALAGCAHRVEVLGDERTDALDRRLGALVAEIRPRAILLADQLTATAELARRRAGPAVLSRFDLPIVALDPWNLPEIGGQVDLEADRPLVVAPQAVAHPLRLLPVPFIRPEAPGACNLLPRVAPLPREQTRRDLGLSAGDRVVFLATAAWQHHWYGRTLLDRAARGVPLLLASYLARLGVQVVHVGPAPFPWPGPGYRHHARLPAETYRALLGAADLMVSLNAPATTATTAVAMGVPVLTLFNGFVGSGLDALWTWLGRRPEPLVAAWAREHLPLHRFLMWPLGAWNMVGTVLAGNPYDALLHRVELLDAERVLATASALLAGEPDPRREAYLARVRRLPGPAEQLFRLAGL